MLTRKQVDCKSLHSYSDGPPWLFTGRAFYQLNLVKAQVAQRFIPSELKLVQAFGYTLGGFYLAQYDTSPAGCFDELVVIAGIVWNPPTSCAWAAKVFVNSVDACTHGKKEIGLPSTYAEFLQEGFSSEDSKPSDLRILKKVKPLLISQVTNGHNAGRDNKLHASKSRAWKVVERVGMELKPLCSIFLPRESLLKSAETGQWRQPAIKISLPSFSGRTNDQPKLLQYSCDLSCRMSLAHPALVLPMNGTNENSRPLDDATGDGVTSLLTSRPILAFKLKDMSMKVKCPKVVT